MNNQEKRFHSSDFEVRNESDKTIVEGYAARFDDETVIGGKFSERVARGAFDNADMSNVVALFNHDWNMPLARSGNGLELNVDEVGLRYRFELGDQSYAKDLAENIRMGNVSTSSFGFTVAGDSWERRDNGVNLRTIDAVGTLFDVSPTTQGAYPTTEVALRSMEAALEVEVPVEVAEVVADEVITDEVVAEEVVAEVEVEETEEEETEEVRAEDAPADDTEEEPKESDEEEEDEEEEQSNDNNNSEPEARNQSPTMENNLNAAPAVVQSLGDTEVRTASNFDFGKFLKEAAKGQVSGLEAEMIQEGNNEMRNAGVNASGGFSIPTMVLRSMGTASATSAAFGGGIGKEDMGIVADYAPSDLAGKLGIRNMTGLSGDVAMQVQSTLTAASGGVAEGAAQVEALPVFGEVVLSPVRYAANVGVTQQMLAQSGDDMAAFIQMDIRRALDKQFNAALITEINANDTAMAYASNNPLDVEAALLAADVDLNDVRFLAASNAYRVMRALSFDAGSGDLFAGSPVSRKTIAGYNGEISSQATTATINFFDNKQIVTGTWGGLNLIVDPYTDAHKGVVRIVANEYRDVEVLNSASFKTLTSVV